MREHHGVEDEAGGESNAALLAGQADVFIGDQRDGFSLNLNSLSAPEWEFPVWPDHHVLMLEPSHDPLHLGLLRLQVPDAFRDGELWVGCWEDDSSGVRIQQAEVVHIGNRDPFLAQLQFGRGGVLLVCLDGHAGVQANNGQILSRISRDNSVVFVDISKVSISKKLENIFIWTELNGLHALGSYPEDVDDDDGGDEVAQGNQQESEIDCPEEVGVALLLNLDNSQLLLGGNCLLGRTNWLPIKSEASPSIVKFRMRFVALHYIG